ncbi:hypothetical protein LX81_01977 [Palleronia aestuarii]|uniref:Argininosuccinate lyase n=1 Tax=Palleronia aestuarii TaxID=568105 RepID=A0A2W7N862_9RHOB|nr:argininosuccinate lyase [Palleronia aestuarii]PZX16605.1 hypothetical protein LX81_01977 [Palleronia aestuarii]
MRITVILLCLAALAGCGANGAPERPGPGIADGPNIDISGTASIGVAGGF